jgi:hypothetical protein
MLRHQPNNQLTNSQLNSQLYLLLTNFTNEPVLLPDSPEWHLREEDYASLFERCGNSNGHGLCHCQVYQRPTSYAPFQVGKSIPMNSKFFQGASSGMCRLRVNYTLPIISDIVRERQGYKYDSSSQGNLNVLADAFSRLPRFDYTGAEERNNDLSMQKMKIFHEASVSLLKQMVIKPTS